jgi:hypothetical protein
MGLVPKSRLAIAWTEKLELKQINDFADIEMRGGFIGGIENSSLDNPADDTASIRYSLFLGFVVIVSMIMCNRRREPETPPETSPEEWREFIAQSRREEREWYQQYGAEWMEYEGMDPEENSYFSLMYGDDGEMTSDVEDDGRLPGEDHLAHSTRLASEAFFAMTNRTAQHEMAVPPEERTWPTIIVPVDRRSYETDSPADTGGASGSNGN